MTYTLEAFMNGEYGDPGDSVHVAVCESCGAECPIEPDGEGSCEACGEPIQSPLLALGLI